VLDYADLPDPIESGEEVLALLEETASLMQGVVSKLRKLKAEDE